MPFLSPYSLLAVFLDNRYVVIIIIVILFLLAERRFAGLMPKGLGWVRRRKRINQLRKEIVINPANADSHLELGIIFLEIGDPRCALPMLEKARERMMDSPRVMALLGKCLFLLERDEEAEALLEQAVQLNSKINYGEPFYYLLRIAVKKKNPNLSALDELETKIRTLGSPEIFYRSGRALLKAKEPERAERMFQESIDNYRVCPKGLQRLHRRWAALSALNLWIFH